MKDEVGGKEAELKFLQEQLTEATRERDRERAANLKIKVCCYSNHLSSCEPVNADQNDFTDAHDRQQAEMKELNNKMQKLSKENSEIRQAFRRLLELVC